MKARRIRHEIIGLTETGRRRLLIAVYDAGEVLFFETCNKIIESWRWRSRQYELGQVGEELDGFYMDLRNSFKQKNGDSLSLLLDSLALHWIHKNVRRTPYWGLRLAMKRAVQVNV